jgi:hypothetical protein
MTINELRKRVRRGERIIVEFTKVIENYEACIDDGMRALISRIDSVDDFDCSQVHFDLSSFESYNDGFVKYNYYDKNGIACLSAKEAGRYPKNGIETIYFDENIDITEFVEIEQIVEN